MITLATMNQGAEIPRVSPEEVGLSSAQLARIAPAMESLITREQTAGVVVAVARKGKLAYLESFGSMNREKSLPMKNESVFRIYSMTKAVATAAAMILVDEGQLLLDDPVAAYVPAFSNAVVHTPEGKVQACRAPTVRDLMRHTAGLTYGYFGNSPVDIIYREREILDPSRALKDFGSVLGAIPLAYQPGEDWVYSVSVDVIGLVVEEVSGMPFDRFLQERLLAPLDMKDTGFVVRPDQRDRFVTLYDHSVEQGLTPDDGGRTESYFAKPKLLSGGGGLVSTVRDYLRFLQMVLNGGELEGRRVLSQKSVELMTTNQLPDGVKQIHFGEEIRHGVGFGLGFNVVVKESDDWDPDAVIGEFGWGGLASTHYWVSPRHDLIVVTMEQRLPYSWDVERALKGLIYQAVIED